MQFSVLEARMCLARQSEIINFQELIILTVKTSKAMTNN